jgi:hypothetical protein
MGKDKIIEDWTIEFLIGGMIDEYLHKKLVVM